MSETPTPIEIPKNEMSLEDLIKNDEISSHQIFAKKRAIFDKLVEDRVNNGMSEEIAKKEVNTLLSAVLKQKRQEEEHIKGEFDHDFLKLYMNDAFLGALSMEVSKIPDSKMPTAYVGVRPYGKDYEVIMGFNPKWFRKLNSTQRQGVIKHEMYHIVFQHIFNRAIGDKEYAYLYNLATDMAINSIIGKDNLPDCCIIPGHRPINPKDGKPQKNPYADFIEAAAPLKASDYYFEELRKIQEKENQNGNSNSIEIAIGEGLGTMDNHDDWDNLPEEVKDIIRDKINDMLGKAATAAERNNDWGSVPHEIQEVIRKLLSREVDWRSVVKNFVGRCRTMDRISTIRRINKKHPYNFPGVKRKYIAKMRVFIDQSGSMTNEDIAKLFSELEGLSKETSFEVYHFDTEIDHNSYSQWKKGRQHPELKRTRCGGTDFSCIAEFCNKPENKGEVSGIIILTDGYAPTMPQIVGARVMWVITEHGTMDAVRPSDLAVKIGSGEKQFKKY